MLRSLTRATLKLSQLNSPVKLEPTIVFRAMSSTTDYNFSTLNVSSPSEFVKHVELNRPDKRNAMNTAFWREIKECFEQLSGDEDCRAVILSGAGKMFTSGLDLSDNEAFTMIMGEADLARKGAWLTRKIAEMQESFNVIEECPKPVIAAVHNGCLGGGIDMTAACDIRYCTQDAWFSIKEVDIGLAADLGTLQRFPKIVGNDSLTRELVYTARNFYADEAMSMGFVSRTFATKQEMVSAALELGSVIASKSPVAIQGSKINMVYSRDHAVSEGLKYQVTYNSLALQSEDVMKAAMATMQKEKAVFSKL